MNKNDEFNAYIKYPLFSINLQKMFLNFRFFFHEIYLENLSMFSWTILIIQKFFLESF